MTDTAAGANSLFAVSGSLFAAQEEDAGKKAITKTCEPEDSEEEGPRFGK